MSTSHNTKIKGLIPKTDKYDKMLTVFNACQQAGIRTPKEVADFFNLDDQNYGYVPPEDGMEVDIGFKSEGDEDCEEGAVYTIDLDQIPTNVKKIIIRSYYC